MTPSEISLFSAKEQALLVATETARLAEMTEDELGDLLQLVRRARNKYTGLHRRQGSARVAETGKRSATGGSNERTLRKAEIFEDALSRVARSLSVAARATRDELKQERLAAARSGTPSSPSQPKRGTSSKGRAAGKVDDRGGKITARRAASTRASGDRTQARRDKHGR